MFGAADERAHAAAATSGWWETWNLDVASEAGIGLAVRLACAPALGVAWWWTHLLLPDLPGPIVVRDHEVGLPRQGLEIRADGLWAELTCETPFEHWTYGLEAFGVRLDDAADSLHGEIGERMPVGLDVEWEVAPENGLHRHGPGREDGYEQFGVVHGEVLVGRSRYELDAAGLRSHTWGTPRFDIPTCAAWSRSPAVAMSFATVEDDRADGHFSGAGGSERITTVRGVTLRRPDGLPAGAHYVLNDHLDVDAEIVGLVVVPLAGPGGQQAVLARGLCRYAGLGQPVIGWSTWLDPDYQ